MSELFSPVTIGSFRVYAGGVHERRQQTNRVATPSTAGGSMVAQRGFEDQDRTPLWRQPNLGHALVGEAASRRAESTEGAARTRASGGLESKPTTRARPRAQSGRYRQWLCHRAVDIAPRWQAHREALRVAIQRRTGFADLKSDGLELPTSYRTRYATRRGGYTELETQALAGAKKNAARNRQIIVFIDESGLSERPTRVRTWSPIAQTPVLQYSFSWKQWSVIAGVTWWQFYFRFFPGSIRGPQMVEFLKALRRQLRGKLLIIWDGLRAHRSRVVREYVEADRRMQLEFLPAYAPELNPVEYVWGHLKTHEIANLCASHISQVRDFARRRLRSMQRRSTLVSAFWKQAELAL